jgi:alpha-L-arabinofuranosidase
MKINSFKIFFLISGIVLSCIPTHVRAQEAHINIDATKIENKISPWLYGSCIEDVNHEIYGGLYDQKIFGESFEEPVPLNADVKSSSHVSAQWKAIQSANVKAAFELDDKDSFNGKYSQMIQFIEGSGIAGISNLSLNQWGIAVIKGKKYQGGLYLKGAQLKGAVKIALQSADGQLEYDVQEIKAVSDQWKKYSFTLSSNATDPKARFAVYIKQPGKLWVDQVTLMGTGDEQFHGLPFRNDIGQAMVKEGLTFIRYGGSMVNAPEYKFKKMIGDPDKRPPYKGNWNPYSSNGFGIEDYLKFCEAAKFQAAFAINIEETPEDAADMIEYLNGPVTSTWGKKRAENGHPKPFNLKFLEIGNEEVINSDDIEGYKHYIKRFNLLYDAIISKDPSIVFINAAWWRPESSNMEMIFKALNGKASYWDYHFWADELNAGKIAEKGLKQMQELFLQWDPDTKMKCAIFEENGGLHNMQRALGHATIQNAVRRFGDFVLTSCAANALQPYLQNDNGWDQGQIFFTSSQVWGMPPYYAQQMAAKDHNPLHIHSDVNGPLDVTATRDEKGKLLVIYVVNTQDHAVSANIAISGFTDIKNVKAIYLSGKLNDINTPEQPMRIIPVEKELQKTNDLKYEFPAYSYTILKYSK